MDWDDVLSWQISSMKEDYGASNEEIVEFLEDIIKQLQNQIKGIKEGTYWDE